MTQANNTTTNTVLHMAMELSQSKWHLAFGDGKKVCEKVIDANDIRALIDALEKAKKKLRLEGDAQVYSCYEAGRDGFWIHRCLTENGIKNEVIDSSSIIVDRKAKRRKTDRIDAQQLLRQLIWHVKGEIKLQTVHVPSEEVEDARRMHRERERLKKERTAHTNRMRSLLNLYGIRCGARGTTSWIKHFREVRDWKGNLLGSHQQEELTREVERLELVEEQLSKIETRMIKELKNDSKDASHKMINQLMQLKGIGEIGAWTLVKEWFSWRKFNNRRELGSAAGLVGSPYNSGNSQKEQGITKAGNKRIRALMIQLSWGWLRYQPNSKLSQWFEERFSEGQRMRKIGIVALARRLLVALWRYLTAGEIPVGTELKTI